MVVVTGAPGHVGNNLVRLLLQRGEKVRAMVLRGEDLTPLKGLDVEIIEGDVREPESLDKAFRGADVVFHLASVISLLPGRTELLEQVNVKGARTAEACLSPALGGWFTLRPHASLEPPHGVGIDEDPGATRSGEHGVFQDQSKRDPEVLDDTQGSDGVIIYPAASSDPMTSNHPKSDR